MDPGFTRLGNEQRYCSDNIITGYSSLSLGYIWVCVRSRATTGLENDLYWPVYIFTGIVLSPGLNSTGPLLPTDGVSIQQCEIHYHALMETHCQMISASPQASHCSVACVITLTYGPGWAQRHKKDRRGEGKVNMVHSQLYWYRPVDNLFCSPGKAFKERSSSPQYIRSARTISCSRTMSANADLFFTVESCHKHTSRPGNKHTKWRETVHRGWRRIQKALYIYIFIYIFRSICKHNLSSITINISSGSKSTKNIVSNSKTIPKDTWSIYLEYKWLHMEVGAWRYWGIQCMFTVCRRTYSPSYLMNPNLYDTNCWREKEKINDFENIWRNSH